METVGNVAADIWWARLKDRYAHAPVDWRDSGGAGRMVPLGLFDSVAENLLQNAMAKRQREPGLHIGVVFIDGSLTVGDDGTAIEPLRAKVLLNEPVNSEDGLGIGLYHAARQAEAMGYRLSLTENRPGRVAFTLSPGS